MVHMIYCHDMPQNKIYPNICNIFIPRFLQVANFKTMIRIKINAYPYTNVVKEHEKHIDFNYEHTGAVCDKHYFLNYVEGSWTKMHSDDDAVSFTGVTIIEQSDDLIGGDTLVLEDRESGRFHKINVDIGETVWYDHDILHAVTNVERGNRKVLVTWMKAQNDS